MKITKLARQKQRPDRVSVYIDEEFAFGVSEADVLSLGLYVGRSLSEAERQECEQAADVSKAYARSVRYIGIRPRSRREVVDYLKRKSYAPAVQQKVLERLQRQELLDDAAFARAWVDWRQHSTPRSRLRLLQELRQKGIDQETIDQALESIGEEQELEQLIELIAKRRSRYDSQQKLMAYLARQGYSYTLIKQALETTEET